MRMNPELRKALQVLAEFYTVSYDGHFGIAETPGTMPQSVMDAWAFVHRTLNSVEQGLNRD